MADSITNWDLCFLCQVNNKILLRCPADFQKTECVDGYKTLAKNILTFHNINALPIPINPKRIDNGDGIEETLLTNRAKYHEACRLLFNNTKLNRALDKSKKRKASKQEEEGRIKRKRIGLKDNICFICDNCDTIPNLSQVQTLSTCEQLKEIATELNEVKILKFVSCEDPIALELKYHKKCYMSLRNRVRNKRKIQESDEDEKYSFAYQRAFCELVVYIHEQYISNSSQSDKPVFRLVKLCELYEKRLVQLGVQNHVKNETRLKNMLLKHIPELDSFKSGREVVFTFKENVGQLLSESSKYDQAIIIEKAAQIL